MFILGTCNKCNHIGVFDVGNRNVEEAKELLSKVEMGECPGFHVEIGSWADYYTFEWNELYSTKKEAINAKNNKMTKEAC